MNSNILLAVLVIVLFVVIYKGRSSENFVSYTPSYNEQISNNQASLYGSMLRTDIEASGCSKPSVTCRSSGSYFTGSCSCPSGTTPVSSSSTEYQDDSLFCGVTEAGDNYKYYKYNFSPSKCKQQYDCSKLSEGVNFIRGKPQSLIDAENECNAINASL